MFRPEPPFRKWDLLNFTFVYTLYNVEEWTKITIIKKMEVFEV